MTMPTYEIFLDGKPKRVELAKNGQNSFVAKVDGDPAIVRLQDNQINSETPFSLNVNSRDYRVELPRIDREKPFQVKVDGVAFNAELKTHVAKTLTSAFAQIKAAPAWKPITRNRVTEGAVTAPMTGKIVSVNVKKGDQVKANQVLCVIEAMKMENEICAPKAGTVQELNVAQGSSVSEGDVLFIVG